MKLKSAFTMIEIIFVILIMGILGTFGVEFLFQAYSSFIFTKVNNNLQSDSTSALEFIASRLQYRIKDSVIARDSNSFDSIRNLHINKEYTVLEWVATDIDGYRATTSPNWSGIIDLNHPDADKNTLISPKTDTNKINQLINILSYKNSDVNDSALYFIGSHSDINAYGWDGVAITDQSKVMHPIQTINGSLNKFAPRVGDFSGVDVYEYFKLSWTANAIVIENYNVEDKTFDLEYYFDYQPWNGEGFLDGKHFTIMQNLSSFRFTSLESIIKIQICAKTLVQKEYSLCKEKTVF